MAWKQRGYAERGDPSARTTLNPEAKPRNPRHHHYVYRTYYQSTPLRRPVAAPSPPRQRPITTPATTLLPTRRRPVATLSPPAASMSPPRRPVATQQLTTTPSPPRLSTCLFDKSRTCTEERWRNSMATACPCKIRLQRHARRASNDPAQNTYTTCCTDLIT